MKDERSTALSHGIWFPLWWFPWLQNVTVSSQSIKRLWQSGPSGEWERRYVSIHLICSMVSSWWNIYLGWEIIINMSRHVHSNLWSSQLLHSSGAAQGLCGLAKASQALLLQGAVWHQIPDPCSNSLNCPASWGGKWGSICVIMLKCI